MCLSVSLLVSGAFLHLHIITRKTWRSFLSALIYEKNMYLEFHNYRVCSPGRLEILGIRPGVPRVQSIMVYYYKAPLEFPPSVGLRGPLHYLALEGTGCLLTSPLEKLVLKEMGDAEPSFVVI